MATYTKLPLSGSTNGKQIKVAAVSSPGTTIHTAVSGTSDMDEIWLFATNTSTSPAVLTLEWGGTTSPDDMLIVGIPAQSGYLMIIPGLVLQNSLIIKAFADVTNVININGFVNRITA